MNNPAFLHQFQQEWRNNARLRYGGLLIAAIVALQLVLLLSDRVAALQTAYTADVQTLARLEGVGKESNWPARAKQASEHLADITDAIPEVTGKGMAQAETQAWLTRIANEQALTATRIKVEDTLAVDDFPDMWQVISRLEGQLPEHGHQAFLHTLAQAQPWVQVERIEIHSGSAAQISVTLRSYYRKAAALPPAAAAQSRAADTHSATNEVG